MKENITEQFINKLKEYRILDAYDKSERLKSDLEKLTEKHIEKFIKLNVEPQNIKFSKKLLINENLLNCNDYEYRIGRWIVWERNVKKEKHLSLKLEYFWH